MFYIELGKICNIKKGILFTNNKTIYGNYIYFDKITNNYKNVVHIDTDAILCCEYGFMHKVDDSIIGEITYYIQKKKNIELTEGILYKFLTNLKYHDKQFEHVNNIELSKILVPANVLKMFNNNKELLSKL